MSVRRRGERWLATVGIGRDERGIPRRTCRTFDTEEAAAAWVLQVKAKLVLGQLDDPTTLTVAAYLDNWAAHHERRVAPATWGSEEPRLRSWKAAIGRHRLTALSPAHIRAFEATLYKRGLSDSTIRKYRMLLQGALSQAVKDGLLTRSPCSALAALPENNPEVRWLSASEQLALVEQARSGFKGRRSRLYELVLLALATGMRQGELLALRWSDVDFARGACHMRRSLQWKPGGGHQFKVHGKSGSRTVPLPASMLELLGEYRTRRAEQLRLAGATSELVFCAEDGEPPNRSGLRSSFRYLAARAGLPPEVHFHCLRHTFATEMLEAGVHPKVVAAWIGDSERTLMRTYAHATPTMQEQAVVAADRHLRGLLGGTAL
jgi:integrase